MHPFTAIARTNAVSLRILPACLCDRLQLSTNADYGRFDVDEGRLYTPVTPAKSEKIMQPVLSSKQINETYGGKLAGSKKGGKKSFKLRDTIVVALEGVAEPRDGASVSKPRAYSDDMYFSQGVDESDPPQRPTEQVMFKLPSCILMTLILASMIVTNTGLTSPFTNKEPQKRSCRIAFRGRERTGVPEQALQRSAV